ncbi:hypothetical protein Zmor_028119, partial [Zophobas morio]
WIDPIGTIIIRKHPIFTLFLDSTAEYINGVEEVDVSGITISGLKCVTVLIGVYDKKSGLPIIGIINQPFVENNGKRWFGRCYWGHPSETSLPPISPLPGTICVSSSEDPTVVKKLKETGYHITEASGAGYKILTVITGFADAYVLTKDSTFKWDTCGPQAILRSLDGDIVVYASALDKDPASVTYGIDTTCNTGGIIAYKDEGVLKDIIKCLT